MTLKWKNDRINNEAEVQKFIEDFSEGFGKEETYQDMKYYHDFIKNNRKEIWRQLDNYFRESPSVARLREVEGLKVKMNEASGYKKEEEREIKNSFTFSSGGLVKKAIGYGLSVIVIGGLLYAGCKVMKVLKQPIDNHKNSLEEKIE